MMEERSRRTSNDMPSPVLLRRRLSAPETIMRKHTLAQQQHSEYAKTFGPNWRNESDPNLSRKRDVTTMRKSTLLRRLWSNSKPTIGSRFSGTFYEWQQLSSGKSNSHSLTSIHSSPEHQKSTGKRHESPQHRAKKLDEHATQTPEITTFNVISNVQLSQSTIDVIFNQVIQDVQNNADGVKPSFFLRQNVQSNEPKDVVKYMMGNVKTGSVYQKTNEQIHAVPRYTALPTTSSMEVNMTSNDSTDRESDTLSLVDSLEDSTSSLRLDDRCCRTKPAAFFIPIKDHMDLKSPVSDHLPDKVRKRLAKRQEKLQNKTKITADLQCRPKLFNRNIEKEKEQKFVRTMKNQMKLYPKKSPTDKARGAEEKRVYHKSLNGNRIEIIEIMECMDPNEKMSNQTKGKSKIPVLVHHKSGKSGNKMNPAYLDLDNVQVNNKLDQLIANILIDTLNTQSMEDVTNTNKSVRRKFDVIPEELSQQSSLEADGNANNNNNNNPDVNRNELGPTTSNDGQMRYSKGKAAVENSDDHMPKGWITFYSLQKSGESPDVTSDEGKKPEINANTSDVTANTHECKKMNATLKKNYYRKCNYRKRQTLRTTKDNAEWSVTVSGSNGHAGPDLEMRFRFSDTKRVSPTMERCQFPEINPETGRSSQVKNKRNEDRFQKDYLPDITQNQLIQKKWKKANESSGSKIAPRHTKTSTRRCNLNRNRIKYDTSESPTTDYSFHFHDDT